jgi:hypothetical protein
MPNIIIEDARGERYDLSTGDVPDISSARVIENSTDLPDETVADVIFQYPNDAMRVIGLIQEALDKLSLSYEALQTLYFENYSGSLRPVEFYEAVAEAEIYADLHEYVDVSQDYVWDVLIGEDEENAQLPDGRIIAISL